MEEKSFYSTDVEWTGQRQGNLTAQSLPALVVDAPPEFKGREGTWTPEHLFCGRRELMLYDDLHRHRREFETRLCKFQNECQGNAGKNGRTGTGDHRNRPSSYAHDQKRWRLGAGRPHSGKGREALPDCKLGPDADSAGTGNPRCPMTDHRGCTWA